jgi:hypothetical protein
MSGCGNKITTNGVRQVKCGFVVLFFLMGQQKTNETKQE